MSRIYELASATRAAGEPRPEAEAGGPGQASPASCTGQRAEKLSLCSAEIRQRHPCVFAFEEDKQAAEEYRVVRTKILRHAAQPRVIAISSADAGDGKTLTALNVAAVLSLKEDTNVLLIDADVRRGRIGGILGAADRPGLTHVLADRAAFEDAAAGIRQYPRLQVLPAGEMGDAQSDLLDSDAWTRLIACARERYRVTLIDTAPLTGILDTHHVMNAADGMLLVVRPDHTNRTRWLNAVKAVPREKMLGVVVNGVKEWFLNRPTNTYYYGG